LLLVSAGHAITTREFALDSAGVLSAGKLEGTAVLSNGVVVPSVGTRRIALENVGLARSLLVAADGTTYIGSGNDGKIWKLVGDVPTLFASTGELLVASLAMDTEGTLYAGTLPKGKIFAIDKQGKARIFAEPKDAEHVWDLLYDARRKTVFAATGPQGKVFAIDPKGKVELYFASKASHVMSLALDKAGRLFAGTSDDALLLRIDAPGRAEVVYDFEGNEITAIAERDGRIAVAANVFPRPPAAAASPKVDEPKKDDRQTTDKTEVPKEPQKPGTGELWVVEADGQARRRFVSDDGHITAVQWADDGAVFAATGRSGRIYRVLPDGTNALWVDVDERQVLDIELVGPHPIFVTGDAGAIYRVLSGAANEAMWTSKVLDAQFPSRWGALSWRGDGKLSFQTRSGSTDKPNETWGEWSSALSEPGPIRSASGRFLQIRARLDTAQPCALYAVQAYYLPGNQSTTLKDIAVKPVPGRKNDGSSDDAPTSIYKIEWKPENPDADRLRFRIDYRPEGKPNYRPIVRESEILTRTSFDWNTDGVPDGYYRVRIESSDELDNPALTVQRDRAESEPFLLDNHPPHVDGMRYAKNVLSGKASDAQGPISKLEYAVDGQDWLPFYPKDDLFDTRDEAFELTLGSLNKGSHVVAVRARDARGNGGSAELWISVP
jgi:sugar lactone lactonase YvrE